MQRRALGLALCTVSCWACQGADSHTLLDDSGANGAGLWAGPETAHFPSVRAPIDPGYPLTAAVGQTCPSGTSATNAFGCVREKRAGPPPPCACEYICDPGCGAGEVCAPDGAGGVSCGCHPALEPNAGGCSWAGLLENGSFESGSAWSLWNEGEEGAVARVEAGELALSVNRRCASAWAGTTARLPSRDSFPDGAALIFEYSARGEAVLPHTLATVMVDGFAGAQALPPSAGTTARRCVQLREVPWLAELEFLVRVGGVCGLPVDYALSVDDVRLEADPSCR